jgi:hypothetical protein
MLFISKISQQIYLILILMNARVKKIYIIGVYKLNSSQKVCFLYASLASRSFISHELNILEL